MSDFPYVGPPPGGLTAAMTTARRRRFRSASTTSGLSAMSLLVVALLAGQSGRTNLVQGPKTEIPAVTSKDREASTDQRNDATVTVGDTTTTSFTLDAAPGATPASPRGAAPVVAAGPAAAGPVSRQEASTVPGGPTYAAGPIKRANTLSVTQCVVGGDGKSATVCPSVYYGDYGPAAAPHQLTADVCSSEPNPVLLRYRGTSEVDFAVIDPKGREVWRWSRWHPLGSAAHTLTLETGSCTTWTFDWTGVDNSGAALPKGAGYRLRARFHADELSTRKVADYAFTLT